MERDVVCGMQVDPAKAAGKSEYNGKTYYFCSPICKKKFDANVNRDLKKINALKDIGWTPLTIWECDILSDQMGSIEHIRRALERDTMTISKHGSSSFSP